MRFYQQGLRSLLVGESRDAVLFPVGVCSAAGAQLHHYFVHVNDTSFYWYPFPGRKHSSGLVLGWSLWRKHSFGASSPCLSFSCCVAKVKKLGEAGMILFCKSSSIRNRILNIDDCGNWEPNAGLLPGYEGLKPFSQDARGQAGRMRGEARDWIPTA